MMKAAKATKVTEKQVAYLTGINDAIVRLEEARRNETVYHRQNHHWCVDTHNWI